MFFSPSKIAFFAPVLEDRYRASGNWPDDLVALTGEEYATYGATPPAGQRLGAEQGRPAWIDVPRYPDAASVERAIVGRINAVAHQLTGEVPDDEKTSWPVKAVAAAAHQAGTATDRHIAMLTAEAERTGETLDLLAERISARAERDAVAIGALTGIRRKAKADLAEASDAPEFAAIADAAIAEIDTLAAAFAAQQG